MDNIYVLLHIKAVRPASTVDLVTTVIHGKSDQSVMTTIIAFDSITYHTKDMIVNTKFGKSLGTFGAFFMHHRIIITIIYYDKIVLILQNDL